MSGGSGYFVHVAESVERYVRGIESLAAERRQQVLDECLQDLVLRADHFLRHYALEHESYTFRYEYVLIDGGLIYLFRFIADGTHMAMGVVQVIYVDHETTALTP